MSDAHYGEDNFNLPTWTTAGRKPTTPGAMGFNSDVGAPEYFDGGLWNQLALAVYSPVTTPEQFGAVGDGVTDDTAAIQKSINAAALTSTRILKLSKTYAIYGSLNIAKPINVMGTGFIELWADNSLPDYPNVAPYFSGAVLKMMTAATDAIQITGQILQVNLSDFGIIFDASIAFTNTGHGVTVNPPLIGSGPYQKPGVVKSRWRNLAVYGHDGNHYAYNTTNILVGDFDQLRSYGGGGLYFQSNSQYINYGNCVFTNPTFVLGCNGTAHGFAINGVAGQPGGLMNLCVFIRPQCNVESFGGQTPSISQYLWLDVTPAGIRDIKLIAPDLEPDNINVSSKVFFGPGTYVDAGGGFLPYSGAAYTPGPKYNPENNAVPTVAVLAGAGTGATAALNGNSNRSTDLCGCVVINVGTSPSSADLVSVTYAVPLQRTPNFIQIGLLYAGAGFAANMFYAENVTTTGFNIRAVNAPTAGYQVQLSYVVVF